MKFTFYAHKPKAERIARDMKIGANKIGAFMEVTDKVVPRPDTFGIFYGVTTETYATFRFYMAEGRAIYLDNGWLSSPTTPTFRFSWNSAQAFLQDMSWRKGWHGTMDDLPPLDWQPQHDRALLMLQSRQYFDFMRLGYTRDQWQRVTTTILEKKGYIVEPREKPTKRDPGAETFFDQLQRAGIVVSLNSASTVKALRYGIPAFCMLDATPSPLAPIRIPDAGRAAPPGRKAVLDMCKRLWSYEITRDDINSGEALQRIMAVPPTKRRGAWYGT